MKLRLIILLFIFQFFTSKLSFSQIPCLGNSIELNGTTDYINIGALGGYDLGNTVTFEAWVEPSNVTQQMAIITRGSINGVFGMALGVENGQIWASGSNTGIWDVAYAGNVIPNKWTHIAATYNKNINQIKIYQNGVLVSTSTRAFTINGVGFNMNIGRNHTSAVQFFSKRINDVRVWNTIRTQSEIQNNMVTELVGNETGLVAYYKMNQNGQGNALVIENSCTITGSTYNGTTIGSGGSPIFVSSQGTYPFYPSIISGQSNVFQGNCRMVYSITSYPNTQTYEWAYSGQNLDGLSVNNLQLSLTYQLNATSGILKVRAITECGTTEFREQAIAVSPNPCPNSNTIDDNSACNLLQQASETISSSATIITPDKIDYKATKSILLVPGFKTQSGSVFKAFTGGCI